MNGMHLLIGIGDDLLADDGIGCQVAAHLSHPDWLTYNIGTIPENFIKRIRDTHPDILVMVDAAQMGLPPGSIRIVPPSRVADAGFGTHQLPLDTLYDVVSPSCEEVMIIGIQPGIIDFGEEMTDPVRKAGERLISLLASNSYRQLEVFNP